MFIFSKYRLHPALCLFAGAFAVLQGCGSTAKDAPFQPELSTADISPYARHFNVGEVDACEAARRAMLSQGYTTKLTTPDSVDANKEFQPSSDMHVSVAFHIVCTPGEASGGTSVVYVNAIQDNYALKKSDTSASVGLSVLGSVSLPIRSSNDSMVKVSSQTIPAGPFYDRFFLLVDHYLKTVIRSRPVSNGGIVSGPLPALPVLPEPSLPAVTAP
ncbi:DUF2242 domain-containing protein [Robbsia betulipollinis]|uniref:DUF2242 domain-containing protein n=1 Tax=Robbsia betulipollinis TaxID=2981849 RepID=UPI0032C3EB2F